MDLSDKNLLSVRAPWLTQHVMSLKCLFTEIFFFLRSSLICLDDGLQEGIITLLHGSNGYRFEVCRAVRNELFYLFLSSFTLMCQF